MLKRLMISSENASEEVSDTIAAAKYCGTPFPNTFRK
jgi:hypothetical protein